MHAPLLKLAAIAALVGLAACETGVRVAPPPPGLEADTPVATVIEVAEADTSGPQMNEIGGEIPKTAPISEVGEDPLTEARPDED